MESTYIDWFRDSPPNESVSARTRSGAAVKSEPVTLLPAQCAEQVNRFHRESEMAEEGVRRLSPHVANYHAGDVDQALSVQRNIDKCTEARRRHTRQHTVQKTGTVNPIHRQVMRVILTRNSVEIVSSFLLIK